MPGKLLREFVLACEPSLVIADTTCSNCPTLKFTAPMLFNPSTNLMISSLTNIRFLPPSTAFLPPSLDKESATLTIPDTSNCGMLTPFIFDEKSRRSVPTLTRFPVFSFPTFLQNEQKHLILLHL